MYIGIGVTMRCGSAPGITDADGNIYTAVVIGTQTWLLENLKTTKYNDGSAIPNLTNAGAWAADVTGAYRWANDDIANKTPYGVLYNWYAASNVKGICPVGYHIPTNAEFNTLLTFLGTALTAGGKMKEVLHSHWDSTNDTKSSNTSGFTAVGSGWIAFGGAVAQFLFYNMYWTSDIGPTPPKRRTYYLDAGSTNLTIDEEVPAYGFNIRCIKD